jgi:hypothetical protein
VSSFVPEEGEMEADYDMTEDCTDEINELYSTNNDLIEDQVV